MPEGKLRYHLVAISSPFSLAEDVALFDQLGDDPVGGPLGDADRGRDVAQADAGVRRDASKDVRVVRQEVPAGYCSRTLRHISRYSLHEFMILCLQPLA